jgi:hypothetical protein
MKGINVLIHKLAVKKVVAFLEELLHVFLLL